MNVKNIFLANESYTHEGWGYRNVHEDFSRLYYIIDGEAYYREKGKEEIRLQKNHLYLTPVRTSIALRENPKDKLNHTFLHIMTDPPVTELVSVEVKAGTLLADAVALLRKHIGIVNAECKRRAVELVLSCMDVKENEVYGAAQRTKAYLDSLPLPDFDMQELSRAVGYSREYLTRSFVSAYGMTPNSYFRKCRMRRALEWLLCGKSVGAVAAQLGYATPYSFSKAFKKYFGMSPEKYLRALKVSDEEK